MNQFVEFGTKPFCFVIWNKHVLIEDEDGYGTMIWVWVTKEEGESEKMESDFCMRCSAY